MSLGHNRTDTDWRIGGHTDANHTHWGMTFPVSDITIPSFHFGIMIFGKFIRRTHSQTNTLSLTGEGMRMHAPLSRKISGWWLECNSSQSLRLRLITL